MRLNKILLKRAVAAFAAACTLGTCCVAGSVAWADPNAGGGTDQGVSTANIDTTKADSTSITIHKYEAPAIKTTGENPTYVRSDGTDQSSLFTGNNKRNPVEGVVFTIWRLKTYQNGKSNTDEEINLTKSEDWKKIKDLDKLVETAASGKKLASDFVTSGTDQKFNKYSASTATTAPSGCTKAAAETAAGAQCTTAKDGSVKLDQLSMGLYYIEETDNHNAQKCVAKDDGNGYDCSKVSITKKTAPFFVTTPLPNPKAKDVAGAWIYDVNVYPKNDTSAIRPKKEVSELNRDDFVPGDVEGHTTITWKISVPLSEPQGKYNTYTNIGFVDKLVNGLVYEKIKSARIVTLDDSGKTAKKDNADIVEELNAVGSNKSPKYYTVETSGTDNDTVKFTLTKSTAGTTDTADTGLGKALAAYNAAAKNNADTTKPKQTATLVVELVTKFKADAKVRDFENVANTFVDTNKTGKGDNTTDPCTPGSTDPDCTGDKTPPTDSAHFGTLTVNKFVKQKANDSSSNDIELPLNGATFDVYEVISKVDGKNTAEVGSTGITTATKFDGSVTTTDGNSTIKTKVDSGTPVTFNVKKVTHKGKAQPTDSTETDLPTTLTTADSSDKKTHGIATVSLFVYKSSKDTKVADTRTYCVVETKAPEGYLLDSTPHCIALKANTTSTAGGTTTITVPEENKLPVENFRATGLDKILGSLPMTGARGLVILTLCGIVGIAGTFFYIVLKRRKEQEQE